MRVADAMVHRVFVYGTLLRGEPNHGLLAGGQHMGEARTRAAFELVDLGYFPAMIAQGNTAVLGEVYAIDEATLRKLDRLEGHPQFYIRTTIELEHGAEVQAYLLPAHQARGKRRILSGNWKARGEHQGP